MKVKVLLICIFMFVGNLVVFGLTISQPNPRTTWCIGEKCKIQWNPTPFHTKYVGIVLVKQKQIVKTIARRVPNNGQYAWTVPFGTIPARKKYQVRIIGIKSDVKKESYLFNISKCGRKGGPDAPDEDLCKENQDSTYCLKVVEFTLRANGNDRFDYILKIKNEGDKCVEAYYWQIFDQKDSVLDLVQGNLGSDGYMIHGNETKMHTGTIRKSKCKNFGNCRDNRNECCNIKLYVKSAVPGSQPCKNTSNWVTLDWGKMTYRVWTY